jgi:hyperosmotically inducible protein
MKSYPIVLAVALAALFGAAGCGQGPDDSAQVNERPRSAAETGQQAGAAVDDSVITTKVKTALLAEPEINGRDISVTVTGGQVTLSGVVPAPQIMRAEAVVRSVEGVNEVVNQLTATGAPS